MQTWLPLLGAPAVSLANLSLAYALTAPSCAMESTAWLHGVNAVCVAVCAVLTAIGWGQWRRVRGHPAPDDAGDRTSRQRFLAAMGFAVGLLFTLVTLAQWAAAWILWPCL
ncbi:hypothetical protein GCM10023144_18080 [Pigmentiphaga soli]|uniref:Uncharacterized protein n=2 Tax=Pigmentiphaga soli TaxID=1007095 RepID=A0ABP8GV54_9BURK